MLDNLALRRRCHELFAATFDRDFMNYSTTNEAWALPTVCADASLGSRLVKETVAARSLPCC